MTAAPSAFAVASPRRRRLLAGAAALVALAACAPPRGRAGAGGLEFMGQQVLPHRLSFAGTTVGGLSAIDFDPATGLYDLLSDDRSDLQPARLYRARLDLSRGQLAAPELIEVVTLRQADGAPWPARRVTPPGLAVPDPEALRRLPDGRLLWTSEGDRPRGFGPALREARADGTLLREFALPPHFAPGPERGTRDNLGFEGLALTPDARGAWVALENALLQDGAEPGFTQGGGPCRITRFDLAQGRATRQFAYPLDPIPAPPVLPYAMNGISEILMLDEHRLLVLERAYMAGRGNSLRLYRVDTREGDDTLALDALAPGNHQPVTKTLVADFAQLGLPRLDNTEGMTWGPRLPDGRRSLLTVSDDNFNPGQITQIAAFAFS